MWVFYLISLPLTVGLVFFTLRYFAGAEVPRYVLFVVGYTWFCSLSIIIIVPADIWTTMMSHANGVISFFWSWSYWSTFLLTWVMVPLIQGFEDAGNFTLTDRLWSSLRANLHFYAIVGGIALVGIVFLLLMKKIEYNAVLNLAMACSNTFGIVTGAFLLGFGLSEIPKSMWRNAEWTTCQKVLSHKIAKMAVKLDEAHQEFSNAIVVAQATSKQLSKRDPLRPYMDIIDNMLVQMFREDPSFKPQGGRLGENDMDYDTDESSMAALRRHLRRAREEYYRYKSEYMTYVKDALELEDTMKNYEHCSATGWKYVSSLRPVRSGSIGSLLDTLELIWRCFLRKQLEKVLAIMLGCLSAAVLLAEAVLPFQHVNLSLFSALINFSVEQELLVQVLAFVPLMYMCVCTYYSLFKIGMLMFYSLTPRQTSSVNLLMICSMVARYAPPISYNFILLIKFENKQTTFVTRMGRMDNVLFFGEKFNTIYPLIMVTYTLLVAFNAFDRVIGFFGNWKRFRFQSEANDMDGFDPSGLIILQKERSWLEQGCNVGEHVIPLARNFNNGTVDVEFVSNRTDSIAVEMKATTSLGNEVMRGGPSKPLKDDNCRYGASKEAISNKYAAIREQSRQASNMKSAEKNMSSAKVSLLDVGNSHSGVSQGAASGLTSTWTSMKTGFQNFRANMGAKKFLPLRQVLETEVSRSPSSESLDLIFQRLKKPALEHGGSSDDDEYGMEIQTAESNR